MRTLPDGRAGQALALVLLVAVLACAWTAVAAPLLEWYADRAETIEGRRTLARRMDQVAATLPDLRRTGAPATAAAVPALEGGTDAVAAAQLQQQVQAMAAQAGATLSSAEVLSAEPAGAYRRIGIRVTLSAPWPVLIRLMHAVAGGQPGTRPGGPPGFTIDDLQLHGSRGFIRDKGASIEASWVVFAFRAGSTP